VQVKRLLLLSLEASQLHPCVLDPSFYRNLKVHDRYERVHSIPFGDNTFSDFFVARLCVSQILHGLTHFVYFDLVLELKDLHLLVYLHAAVLLTHAPI
jgi:hypothetical protein